MAIFNITVTENTSSSNQPIVISSIIDSCESNVEIEIPVPSGQSRYVKVVSSGNGSVVPLDIAEIITSNNTYLLSLIGLITEPESLNTEFAEVTLTVALTATSEIYYSKKITRTHTGVNC